MPKKIYNKNAREKALLEEAYSSVYNESGIDWKTTTRDGKPAIEGNRAELKRKGAVRLESPSGTSRSTLPKGDPKIEKLKKQGYTEIPIEDAEDTDIADQDYFAKIDPSEDEKAEEQGFEEGAMGDLATAAGKGIKSVGSGLGRLGAAGAGAVAAGTGAALGGIYKVLDKLTAEQLTKIGNYALQKAAEDEENDVIKGDVPPPPTTDPNDPDYIHPIVP